jgi:hypothetical protein
MLIFPNFDTSEFIYKILFVNMILLTVTPFGWAFFGAIALSLLLTRSVVRRMSPHEAPGCMTYGFTGLILTFMMVFVLTFSITISQSIYGFFVKPKYQATVISFSSQWEEREDKDSNGRRTKRRVLMHRPTVRFLDREGKTVTLETDISSGAEPVIGEKIKVVYAPGDSVAHELSLASIGLLFGAFLMLFIIGIILVGAIQYARGADMSGIRNFGIGFVMKFLFPFGMLFLLSGMGYALWQNFAGKKDMPGWAVGVCGFFCLTLLLVLPGYLKMAFARKERAII